MFQLMYMSIVLLAPALALEAGNSFDDCLATSLLYCAWLYTKSKRFKTHMKLPIVPVIINNFTLRLRPGHSSRSKPYCGLMEVDRSSLYLNVLFVVDGSYP